MSLHSALKAIEPRIEFVLAGASESGKTQVWEATVADGTILGVVSWFGRWRKYTFWPHQRTVFDHSCLREIADFCEQRTNAKRFKVRKTRPA
ncbi:MAG: hypothetical protein ACT4PE_05650 [Candidatus Eiseniibacteriota bacterium]